MFTDRSVFVCEETGFPLFSQYEKTSKFVLTCYNRTYSMDMMDQEKDYLGKMLHYSFKCYIK